VTNIVVPRSPRQEGEERSASALGSEVERRAERCEESVGGRGGFL
jgi:hypothetical protein